MRGFGKIILILFGLLLAGFGGFCSAMFANEAISKGTLTAANQQAALMFGAAMIAGLIMLYKGWKM